MKKFMIRDVTSGDFADIETLNTQFVAFTSELDLDKIARLHDLSAYHKVIVEVSDDGAPDNVAGFLLVMSGNTAYDSPNYQWFDKRYQHFLYIDRIVLSDKYQGQGLGIKLYNDLIEFAQTQNVAHVCCEYNVVPLNKISAKFHQKFGFYEVEKLSSKDLSKVVSMQILDTI